MGIEERRQAASAESTVGGNGAVPRTDDRGQGDAGPTRRQLLSWGGVAGVLILAPPLVGTRAAGAAPGSTAVTPPSADELTGPAVPHFIRTLRRREDQAVVTFEFHNLKVTNTAAGPRLSRALATVPAYIVAHLGPQHLAEESVAEQKSNGTEPTPPAPPGELQTRLARSSRVVFEVLPTTPPFPYDAEHLLAWTGLRLSVVPVARTLTRGPAPTVREPKPTETAIELPYDLVLSPTDAHGFTSTGTAAGATQSGRTELWHARLGLYGPAGLSERTSTAKSTQAIWTSGYEKPAASPNSPPACNPLPPSPPAPAEPFVPSKRDRTDVVYLTSDRSLGTDRHPLATKRLLLSSLGGWLDVEGHWDTQSSSLLEWSQRTAQGRDSFVRIVRKGRLYPIDHKAVTVRIVERKVTTDAQGRKVAYLRQRLTIGVIERELAYPRPGQAFGGRAWPFQRIRVTTLVTPNLWLVGSPLQPRPFVPGYAGELMFEPFLADTEAPFRFGLVGTDRAGREHPFTSSLVWVDEGCALDDDALDALADAYRDDAGQAVRASGPKSGQTGDPAVRRIELGGRGLAFASTSGAAPGSTTFETGTTVLDVTEPTGSAVPRFHPKLATAAVRVQAAERITGAACTPIVSFDDTYLGAGFTGANASGVFLKVADGTEAPAVDLAARSDRSGGVAAPSLTLQGLSRRSGIIGGTDTADLASNTFDPSSFLSPDAVLLGGVTLADVIQTGQVENAPTIRTTETATELVTELTWDAQLQASGIVQLGEHPTLQLRATSRVPKDAAAEPTVDVVGDMRDVVVRLLADPAFIEVPLPRLTFTSHNGSAPDVAVVVGDVAFLGDLSFVNDLREYLSSLGPGLHLDVDSSGIEAGLELPIPNIAVGVFALQNVKVLLGFKLPFDGSEALVTFGFSTRDDPFQLTIAMFGGGGWLELEAGLSGVKRFFVALEFGASASIDVGIASGGVEIMAGVYLELRDTDSGTACRLGGYLRIDGHLTVAIASVSIGLELGFEYDSGTDKAIGRAMFYAEVSVAFFSATIEAEVERRFGGEGDPTFAELMEPDDWSEYCAAFAAVGGA